ncbi:methylmalonyl Co-A mutase-associated GTPase MeaB [Sphingobium sp. YC-XJ3]|uniref:methylmalonyl Co-A mutase-associated GTPase MeaB n=1 Tax=Sphingobium sp. YC-XJ3 TaxID=3024245 RepID=UPI00235EDC46|nr:methylmalonyl Co-A mutase-associated GTPase MeaB [Sphingobium sp. YC-XJ3]WDA39270.1 methylmalonyl Co-A mutase-associated GTPase MeaB [Sphingobium sp. YC-XJ3]
MQRMLEQIKVGDSRAVARAITIMEMGGAAAADLHRVLLPLTGTALTIGFTGPPGAGKSTLIDAFITELRQNGRTVAVAAVDPSSPLSGGAVLGDRIRMGQHTEDPGVFIRSIASRGHVGGLNKSIQAIVDVLDVSGRDVVVIETVGAGQSEVEVAEVADIKIVVNAPGLGDDVQAIKAGILEIASILVVNKADLPLAARTVRQLKSMLALRNESRQNVPVIQTVATSGKGVAELLEAILGLSRRTSDEHRARRRERVHRLVAEAAAASTRRHVLALRDKSSRTLLAQVERGEVSIDGAAQALATHKPGAAELSSYRWRQRSKKYK